MGLWDRQIILTVTQAVKECKVGKGGIIFEIFDNSAKTKKH